ncbi:hypothetical protein SAMN05216582_10650 [Selenomonas ruminantium]|uniref:Uncharacterized protein n=1 Tax=Selenomonas ruminantium TaxID=971 RepID=A0A1M6T3B3_SELRU|nr:hypothetical protein [Selenomonas ruminantium]SHK51431.1 hypothetical protein SAMN05216582_10650 [Selenomonas ruminantium]
MNQMKKISKNISSNIMKNIRLQQMRASLTKITAVVAVTMTVLAQSLIAEAQAAEPDVTRDMRALEQKGVYLTGLTNRIKAEDSLMQKILTDAVKDNVDLGQAADGISDVLRYTLVIKEQDYSRRVPEAMEKLTASGYEVLKFRNAWGGKFYQGINVQLLSPAGVKTELQFHTPQSYAIKQASHGVYEIRRNPEATPEEVADATAKSIAYNAQVKVPTGAKNIIWA